LIEERSRDIADTSAEPDNTGDEDLCKRYQRSLLIESSAYLFRLTAGVRGDQGEREDEGGLVRSSKIA